MSITGKVDAMMGGLRRENNALRKNYERERTRTTVLESRILHAFLAAVHAELPCPFCGADTNYVSPFARHIGDCIVETIELAVASPPSVSEPKYTAEKPLTLSYREPRPSEAVMQPIWTEDHHRAQTWLAEHVGRDHAAGEAVETLVRLLAEVREEVTSLCEVCDEERATVCGSCQAQHIEEAVDHYSDDKGRLHCRGCIRGLGKKCPGMPRPEAPRVDLSAARSALEYLRGTASGNDYVNDYELRAHYETVDRALDALEATQTGSEER